ncbi:phage regulatory CII family protein [Rhodoferax sp. WC2427]|uniref:phage regulatory CII family protein n=1 Tax=Rhodoferax sp. WC2427 TaxID=3234144 RepID=UPI00346775FB
MTTKHEVGPTANPFRAFSDLVDKAGTADLAVQMGMRIGTLYNKADADEKSHHQPTLRDVMLATRLTGDMRVLDAMNESFGRAAFDVRPHTSDSDEALLELVCKLGAEHGEFLSVVRSALIDHNFNRHALNAIRAEAFDVVGALMTLVARLEGLLDD